MKRLVIALILALIARPSLADHWPKIPFMDDMNVKLVAENIKYNGVWMNAYELGTREELDQVIAFYQGEWGSAMTVESMPAPKSVPSDQGAIPYSDKEDWKLLTHREDDFLITVQLGKQVGGNGTLGYVGVSNAFAGPRKPYASDFPMPETSQLVSEIFADDLGKHSRTVLFTNHASVEHNLQFYRNYYGHRGWNELGQKFKDKSMTSAAGGALLMSKGDQELNLTVTRQGIDSYVNVVLVGN